MIAQLLHILKLACIVVIIAGCKQVQENKEQAGVVCNSCTNADTIKFLDGDLNVLFCPTLSHQFISKADVDGNY